MSVEVVISIVWAVVFYVVRFWLSDSGAVASARFHRDMMHWAWRGWLRRGVGVVPPPARRVAMEPGEHPYAYVRRLCRS